MTEQDTKIAGLVLKQGRACILVVNKWDLKADDVSAGKPTSKTSNGAFLSCLGSRAVYFCPGAGFLARPVCPDRPGLPVILQTGSHRQPESIFQGLLEEHPLPVRKGKPAKASKSAFMTQVATRPRHLRCLWDTRTT